MKKHLFRRLLLTLASPLLATALLLASPAAQAAGPYPEAVRIAASGYVKGGKLQIGGTGAIGRIMKDGWLEAELKKRGVRLEWFPYSGEVGPTLNEAFAANRIDFASYGDLPSIILNASGIRTQIVVPAGRGTDVFLVVPPNSTAKSLPDLKGKVISLNRSRPWELGFQRLMQDNGLSYKDFRMINTDLPAGEAALASGRVDALFTLQAYILEDKKIGKIIWSSKGEPDKKMRAELWGAQTFIDKYPEITQLVATAYLRAQYWASLDENREAVILDGTRNGTPESVIRRNYDDSSLAWKDRFSPLYDPLILDHYRRAIAFAYEKKLIQRPIKAEDLLQPRFVNTALSDLKLKDYWQPAPAPTGKALASTAQR